MFKFVLTSWEECGNLYSQDNKRTAQRYTQGDKEMNNLAYYWLTFKYDGEETREKFVDGGVKELKETVAFLKSKGAKINTIINKDNVDVTKRYDK